MDYIVNFMGQTSVKRCVKTQNCVLRSIIDAIRNTDVSK